MNLKIHFSEKIIQGFKFIDFRKTFNEIIEHIFKHERKINDIYKFFISDAGYQYGFVNFKVPENHYRNDLMLAKFKIVGTNRVVVKWINGMSCVCKKQDLNIKSLNKEKFAASGSDTSRITPNPEKGSDFVDRFLEYNSFYKNYLQSYTLSNVVQQLFKDMKEFEKNQANGENPKQDNPVPSLGDIGNLTEEVLEYFGRPNIEDYEKVKKIIEIHLNG